MHFRFGSSQLACASQSGCSSRVKAGGSIGLSKEITGAVEAIIRAARLGKD